MAKRLGTVLVFKEGVSKEEAAQHLARIAEVLDLPKSVTDYVPIGPPGGRRVKGVQRAFKVPDIINEFDDEYGGPVWYIP
jgi:hypothetical protein